jgi:hypothetical protein
MVDGTIRRLREFDQLRNDAGYVGTIETRFEDMASSPTIKLLSVACHSS